jgi:hypothetical protein
MGRLFPALTGIVNTGYQTWNEFPVITPLAASGMAERIAV